MRDTTLKSLDKQLQDLGFRTGYSAEKEALLILSKGYLLLGEVRYNKQCDVRLNGHFERMADSLIKELAVLAIAWFISTPFEDRQI